MLAIFRMFAHYNAWANARIYAAVAPLSDADYRADLGAFFHSLHGTLNHLLVTDRIWMARFTGSGDAPRSLDAILFDDFADLHQARIAEDQRIITWLDGLTASDLDQMLRYQPISNPTPVVQPLAPTLSHVFNHQTHHRGQVHALLTRLAGSAPSIDLAIFQRATGMGMT